MSGPSLQYSGNTVQESADGMKEPEVREDRGEADMTDTALMSSP